MKKFNPVGAGYSYLLTSSPSFGNSDIILSTYLVIFHYLHVLAINETEDKSPNSKAWLNHIDVNALISISRQHQCVVPDSVLLYVFRRVVCFKKVPIHNCAVLIVDLSAGKNIRKISYNKNIYFLVLAQCLLSFLQF